MGAMRGPCSALWDIPTLLRLLLLPLLLLAASPRRSAATTLPTMPTNAHKSSHPTHRERPMPVDVPMCAVLMEGLTDADYMYLRDAVQVCRCGCVRACVRVSVRVSADGGADSRVCVWVCVCACV
jgi:hypothetical protein